MYDLLDLALESYRGFCDEYEASGKDVEQLRDTTFDVWSLRIAQGADYYAGCRTLYQPTRAKKFNLLKLRGDVYWALLYSSETARNPSLFDEVDEIEKSGVGMAFWAKLNGFDFEEDAPWIITWWPVTSVGRLSSARRRVEA